MNQTKKDAVLAKSTILGGIDRDATSNADNALGAEDSTGLRRRRAAGGSTEDHTNPVLSITSSTVGAANVKGEGGEGDRHDNRRRAEAQIYDFTYQAIGWGVWGSVNTLNGGTAGDITTYKTQNSDIWWSWDDFSFAHIPTATSNNSSDFLEVVMSTEGFSDGAADLAKFGLMIRNSLGPSSRHFSVFVTGSQGTHAFYRLEDGGGSDLITGFDDKGSGSIKIVKTGNEFTAFYKDTGAADYVQIGTDPLVMDMSEEVYVGIALSTLTEYSDTMSFSDFSLVGSTVNTVLPTNCPSYDANAEQLFDVSFAAVGDEVTGEIETWSGGSAGDITSTKTSSSDIWYSEDHFSYASFVRVPFSSSEAVEVVLNTEGFDQGAYEWSKFGLMIRDSLIPESSHFSVFISPGHGTSTFYRESAYGGSFRVPGFDNQYSGYLKIVKVGNEFRAFHKEVDENNNSTFFKEIGTPMTIDMKGEVHVGIALSTHYLGSRESETVGFTEFSYVGPSDSGSGDDGSAAPNHIAGAAVSCLVATVVSVVAYLMA